MSTDTFTAPSAPARELEGPGRARRALRAPDWLALSRSTVIVALLVMLGVSVWLRTVALHFYFWVDEGISVGIASHPLSQIPGLMRRDGSPPLYYLLLHVWMSWRGHSEVATHEFSLIFALLCIPVAYWAGASLWNRRTGLICAGLAAGAPYLTIYAQETRMYSLVALLSLVLAASFVHGFVYHRRRYLPVFSISLAAALYSHNWALFLAVISVVAFLWCLRAQPTVRPRMWRDGLIGFGAVAILYLPWLPTLLYQTRHTGAPWDLPPVIWSLSQGLYFLVGGRGVAMLLLLGGGAGLLTLRRRAEAAAAPTVADAELAPLRLAAECLLILGLGTLLLAWAASKVNPAWATRYLAVIVGPLILVVGLGLARGGRLAIVAMVLTACFWILDPVAHNRNAKSNVASVAAAMRPHVHPSTLVLSTQPEQVPTIAYYLPQVRQFGTPLGPVADPRVMDWRDALSKLKRSSVHTVLGPMIAALKPGQRVMLVTPVRFPTSPEWMVLINRATARWWWFLAHDPNLRLIADTNAYWYDAGVNVQAWLWIRR